MRSSTPSVRIPPILYGTAWKKGDTARLVALAIATGFRGLDTACQPKHYDEAGVGAGIAARLGAALRREDLYLQTKFTGPSGQDPQRMPYDRTLPLEDQIAASVAASLRNLRTDYLDCLILHSPLPSVEETLQAWRSFEALVERGLVRQLGISNLYRLGDLEHLHRHAHIKPAVLQNRFYRETGYDRALRHCCADQGIIYESFWTLSANPTLLASPALRAVATRRGRSPAQILFRYLTQAGVVPLTGTTSAVHMREALSIVEFELDGTERGAIDALLEP
jgi:diketogulonate reductase-like aldo/keto reductase